MTSLPAANDRLTVELAASFAWNLHRAISPFSPEADRLLERGWNLALDEHL
jgi:hypothetical protein